MSTLHVVSTRTSRRRLVSRPKHRRRLTAALLAASAVVVVSRNPVEAVSQPSFRCSFTEPFSAIVVSAGSVIYAPNDGNDEPHEKLSSVSVTNSGTRYRILGTRTDGSRFAATIRKATGSDGMSEFTTDYAGVIDGRPDSGACTRHHAGWSAAKVTGVADNDVLNVRASGRSSARIVATADPNSIVFRATGAVNGWTQVSVAVFPASGSGRIRVVEGWANTRFLAPYPA